MSNDFFRQAGTPKIYVLHTLSVHFFKFLINVCVALENIFNIFKISSTYLTSGQQNI